MHQLFASLLGGSKIPQERWHSPNSTPLQSLESDYLALIPWMLWRAFHYNALSTNHTSVSWTRLSPCCSAENNFVFVLHQHCLTTWVLISTLSVQCQHLIPALNARAFQAYTVRPIVTKVPVEGCVDKLKTECSLDSQATWAIYVLNLFLDMLSIVFCKTRHRQTSSRLVCELNVCTLDVADRCQSPYPWDLHIISASIILICSTRTVKIRHLVADLLVSGFIWLDRENAMV